MVQNRWKQQLARAGMKQNELADAVAMNRGELSRVCQGVGIVSLDKLEELCNVLGCKPIDVYGEDEMRVLYQADVRKKPKKPTTVSIRIRSDVAEIIDEAVARGEYASRNEAANSIIAEVLA